MAAFVACALCVIIIIKPQEFLPALEPLQLVNVSFALFILCAVADVTGRRLRPALAPQIPIFFAFLGWALLVTLGKAPEAFVNELRLLAILAGVFLAVAVGMASTRGIQLFVWVFLGCAIFTGGVALTQYFNPLVCFLGDKDDWAAQGAFVPDGRPCVTATECYKDAPVLDGNYICERGGVLNTHSTGGRIRYRSSLADPNELSLMLVAALPFGLALAEARRRRALAASRTALPVQRVADALAVASPVAAASRLRVLPSTALLGTTGFTVAVTQSRTGVIAYLVVTGIYFIRRVGAWGVVVGCLVAPPMLLYGGRSGSEADSSSDERTELLLEAFEFIRQTKGIGVGAGRFPSESSISMTAHNAYMLVAAETGLVGLALFGLLLYASLKVPYALWFGDYRLGPVTTRFAPALAISLSGVAVGIVFLSWTYKDILYMLLGASAALYAVAKSEDPRVDLRLTSTELLLVPMATMALIVVFYLGARLRH